MTETQETANRKQYVDIDEALARVRGNKKFYRRMLGLFLGSGEFAAMDEALAAADYGKAADVAHGIKGMTGNLSLTALFKTSTRMMDTLRQGSLDESALAEYRDAYAKTKLYVEEVARELDAEV
ncbi:MAG: Hpt domain-containing protein [Peptococcaceae bacterium]|jgi:HPt (histidine-containing phosphotransfer) domain-containing protein|nr:Hpt domain-containing protein [Peptococcaceae bacterium]